MKTNKLIINYSKTEFMLVIKKKINYFNVKINGLTINRNNCIKYLGILIADKIKWKNHIENSCSKLSRRSWIINNMRHFVYNNTLLIIYYSLIYPHIQYSITSWGRASAKTLDPLIKLQKRIVRSMTFIKYNAHTQPLFENLIY